MDTFEKRLIGFAIIAISVLSILIVLAPNHSVYAPGSRRWPVNTGMNLPLVNILDENGYYASLSCKVTSFNNEAHTYNLSCSDPPEYVTVRGR
jgi:hypothetical protein